MKISTKSRYGVRAIIEISMGYGLKPVKRVDIVKKNPDISGTYLENILIILKKNGIIEAKRGSKGGFVLTRHPSKITVLDVVLALEGSIAPLECVEHNNCDRLAICLSREIWKKLYDSYIDILSNISFQEIVDKASNQQISDYVI